MKAKVNISKTTIATGCISFKTLAELTDYYRNSNLPKPLQIELSICKAIIDSEDFTPAQKAEVLVMGGHQWNLSAQHIASQPKILNAVEKSALWTRPFNSFEDLYDAIVKSLQDKNGKKLSGAGKVLYYDLAKRIGYCIGCNPTDYVYMTSQSVCTSAKALLGRSRIPVRLPLSDFTPYLNLNASEIENVLCIMDGYFIKHGVNPLCCKRFDHIKYRNCFSDKLRKDIIKIFNEFEIDLLSKK